MPYDLIVIGSGPGGYVCAIRAAQLGMKVAVVEKEKTFGGTCLNVGCIPSKALLHASELFEESGHLFGKMGIKLGQPKLDLAAMMKFKDEGVDGNVKGVAFLFKKNKIETFAGLGRIAGPGKVEVKAADGTSQSIEGKAIVIATGSDVARLRGVEIDEERIVSSTGALVLDRVPQRLLVIGAGVIGLELGSVWRRLGSEVIVVEFLDRILPGLDSEVCRQFQRLLEKQGITFKLSSKVTGVEISGNKLKATVEPAAGGAAEAIDADVVLVSIGRVPFTEGLGLEQAGVKTDDKGRVIVDARYATNVPGIYAIGDAIAGPMLAHKAQDEGVAVAEIVFDRPGLAPQELRARGEDVVVIPVRRGGEQRRKSSAAFGRVNGGPDLDAVAHLDFHFARRGFLGHVLPSLLNPTRKSSAGTYAASPPRRCRRSGNCRSTSCRCDR